jgi:hypothetical protein
LKAFQKLSGFYEKHKFWRGNKTAGLPWRLINWVMCPLVTLIKIWISLMDVRCPPNILEIFSKYKLESKLHTVDSTRYAFLGKPFTIAFSLVLEAGNTIGTLNTCERNAAKRTMKLGRLCMN